MKEKKKNFKSPFSDQAKETDWAGSEKGEEIEEVLKQASSFERPVRGTSLSLVIVLVIFFGFLAGIVGEIIFRTYLVGLPFFSNLNLSNQLTSGQSVVIKEPKKVVVDQDLIVDQTFQSINSKLVRIYSVKSASKNINGQIYLPTDLLGEGLILTSDGWVMTNKSVISDPSKSYSVFTADNQEFTVSDFIADSATDLIFFNIKATNLSVAKFGDSSKLSLGQTLLAITPWKVVVTNLESTSYRSSGGPNDLFLSSEKFSKYLLIRDNLDQDFAGAPLVNLAGEVVGLETKGSSASLRLALPINYTQGAIASLLRAKAISRPYLGLRYLDLAASPGLDQSLTAGFSAGALVSGSDQISAIEANSPAKKSGLKKGDIITKVGDSAVNNQTDLTELIQENKPGDIIDLTVERDKQEKTIKVGLSTSK